MERKRVLVPDEVKPGRVEASVTVKVGSPEVFWSDAEIS